jgi:Tfp pilus assembly protein PilO
MPWNRRAINNMKSFTSLIVIIVCVLAYFLYIGPAYSSTQTLLTQKNNYDQILIQTKATISKRDQILASYNSISADNLSRLSKIIPANFNPVTFVSHLNTVANKYGLVIDSMQIVQQANDSGQVVATVTNSYKTQNVDFSVKGQYASVMSFLKDLESGLDLVDVTTLSLKRDSSDKNGSTFDFEISLNTYSLN